MPQATIQIRLPKQQLQAIDFRIKKGEFSSRSEAIRAYIHRMELLDVMKKFQGIVDRAGVDKQDALKNLSAVREEIYRKFL